MRRIIIRIAVLGALLGGNAGAQEIPERVEYKKTTPERNQTARKMMLRCLAPAATHKQRLELFDDLLIIGPVMWKDLRDAGFELTSTPAMHSYVPVPDGAGNMTAVDIGGGALRSAKAVSRFVNAFSKNYKHARIPVVRKLTPAEMDTYWTVIPFAIEEPVFIAEMGKANILMDFSGSNEISVLWVENIDQAKQDALVEAALTKQRAEQEKEKQELIKKMTKQFGSRKAGAEALAGKGWARFQADAGDEAAELFENVQVLDPRNPDGPWGLSMTIFMDLAQGRESPEAIITIIALQEQALELAPKNSRIMGDLAYAYSNAAKLTGDEHVDAKKELCTKSVAMFEKAVATDPTFATFYLLWSTPLIQLGRYKEAWEKIEKTRNMGMEIPRGMIEELRRKMPDPYEKPPKKDARHRQVPLPQGASAAG